MYAIVPKPRTAIFSNFTQSREEFKSLLWWLLKAAKSSQSYNMISNNPLGHLHGDMMAYPDM